MSSLVQDIREKMMNILKIEEDRTDLENLAVLSRVGMKVASALSSELDADATSASSTALIDLGLRLSEATAHGALTEIILHNTSGYSILLAINDEYIVFGGLKNVFRIGYYLGYLRELAMKLNRLISGDEITEMTLSLEESERHKLVREQQ
jgi:predicted regulator of Ras-like GTPase activity (Roadblock/LC7/MglB family)